MPPKVDTGNYRIEGNDYALIESLDEEITRLCKSAEIVDKAYSIFALYGDVMVRVYEVLSPPLRRFDSFHLHKLNTNTNG